jgi:hypothetical protein
LRVSLTFGRSSWSLDALERAVDKPAVETHASDAIHSVTGKCGASVGRRLGNARHIAYAVAGRKPHFARVVELGRGGRLIDRALRTTNV